VVAVAFQSSFCSKIHQNNVLFFKIIFDISTSKLSKNIKKILTSSKKKILNFYETPFGTAIKAQAKLGFKANENTDHANNLVISPKKRRRRKKFEIKCHNLNLQVSMIHATVKD
jgi:cellobiose-specific phosphotransferase system component IIB